MGGKGKKKKLTQTIFIIHNHLDALTRNTSEQSLNSTEDNVTVVDGVAGTTTVAATTSIEPSTSVNPPGTTSSNPLMYEPRKKKRKVFPIPNSVK